MIARTLVIASGLIALGAALSGCRSISSGEELGRELGPDAVVISVPPVKQEALKACGLACLISLLDWSGAALDDEARTRFPPARLEKEEIAAGELRDYLRTRGFRVALVRGSLDGSYPRGIFTVLGRGVPPIVEVGTASSRHYVLVRGYDPKRALVLFMDPEHGLAAMTMDDFAEAWARANHLMLVAVPPPSRTPAAGSSGS